MSGLHRELSSDQCRAPCVSWVPELPAGATLYSLVAYVYRATGSRSAVRTTTELHGRGQFGAASWNPMGVGAQTIAEKIYAGGISGLDLIKRHTLLGLCAGIMGNGYWSDHVIDRLAQGSKPGSRMKHLFQTKVLSWCPICMEEDISNFGWAPWRVGHQVPFIHHCHIHSVPLLTVCQSCGSPVGRGYNFVLPGEACRHCGGTRFQSHVKIADSFGYQKLLSYVGDIVGSMWLADSEDWRSWTNERLEACHESEVWRDIVSQVSKEWECGDPESNLASLLHVSERTGFIRHVLKTPHGASFFAKTMRRCYT